MPPCQVFISHSHTDAEIAARLNEGLVRKGLRTFVSSADNRLGDAWYGEVSRALAEARVYVCLVTERYLRAPEDPKGDWIEKEVLFAMKRGGIDVVPVYYRVEGAGRFDFAFGNIHFEKFDDADTLVRRVVPRVHEIVTGSLPSGRAPLAASPSEAAPSSAKAPPASEVAPSGASARQGPPEVKPALPLGTVELLRRQCERMRASKDEEIARLYADLDARLVAVPPEEPRPEALAWGEGIAAVLERLEPVHRRCARERRDWIRMSQVSEEVADEILKSRRKSVDASADARCDAQRLRFERYLSSVEKAHADNVDALVFVLLPDAKTDSLVFKIDHEWRRVYVVWRDEVSEDIRRWVRSDLTKDWAKWSVEVRASFASLGVELPVIDLPEPARMNAELFEPSAELRRTIFQRVEPDDQEVGRVASSPDIQMVGRPSLSDVINAEIKKKYGSIARVLYGPMRLPLMLLPALNWQSARESMMQEIKEGASAAVRKRLKEEFVAMRKRALSTLSAWAEEHQARVLMVFGERLAHELAKGRAARREQLEHEQATAKADAEQHESSADFHVKTLKQITPKIAELRAKPS